MIREGLPNRKLMFRTFLMGNCIVYILSPVLLIAFGTNLGRFTIEMLFQYSPRITNEKPNSIIEYTVMK